MNSHPRKPNKSIVKDLQQVFFIGESIKAGHSANKAEESFQFEDYFKKACPIANFLEYFHIILGFYANLKL
jgi:hypothetical protein